MKSLLIISLAILAASAEELFCVPGLLFKIDCNTCTCLPNGKMATCTDMICPQYDETEDFDDLKNNSESSNQICKPLSKFNEYCNTCFCADDGSSYSCTEMPCDKDIWQKNGSLKIVTASRLVTKSDERLCEPDSQFKHYCNTCRCSDDGLSYACTRKLCDKDIWHEDGSLKTVSTFSRLVSGRKQICSPRTQFKDYCNTCACADDGLSFACTNMRCSKEIWKKDGSMRYMPEAHGTVEAAALHGVNTFDPINCHCACS